MEFRKNGTKRGLSGWWVGRTPEEGTGKGKTSAYVHHLPTPLNSHLGCMPRVFFRSPCVIVLLPKIKTLIVFFLVKSAALKAEKSAMG